MKSLNENEFDNATIEAYDKRAESSLPIFRGTVIRTQLNTTDQEFWLTLDTGYTVRIKLLGDYLPKKES